MSLRAVCVSSEEPHDAPLTRHCVVQCSQLAARRGSACLCLAMTRRAAHTGLGVLRLYRYFNLERGVRHNLLARVKSAAPAGGTLKWFAGSWARARAWAMAWVVWGVLLVLNGARGGGGFPRPPLTPRAGTQRARDVPPPRRRQDTSTATPAAGTARWR